MFTTIAKVVVGILLLSGVYVWVFEERDVLTPIARANPEAVTGSVTTFGTDTEFVAEGVLLRYQSSDIPVYYLLYENQSHRFIRKELRFTDVRGCSAQAGDLPCVFQTDQNAPPVPLGSYVRVAGVLDAQRVEVDSLMLAQDERANYHTFTARMGELRELDTMSARLLAVRSSDGCTLFVGCYADDIPQASFEVTSKGRTSDATLVPGMVLNVPGGVLVLVWADAESGSATFILAQGKE